MGQLMVDFHHLDNLSTQLDSHCLVNLRSTFGLSTKSKFKVILHQLRVDSYHLNQISTQLGTLCSVNLRF